MKLVFLYGPPAVGKLTVANELAKITGYKVFHNHLTNDVVEAIFERGTKQFEELVDRYRIELIEEAAKAGISIIFTFVYAKDARDAKFVTRVITAVERRGGSVCFVQLMCHPRELFKRLKHPSRKKFRKIQKESTLKELMERKDVVSSIKHRSNVCIDNTNLSPKKTAQLIKKQFKL